MRVWEKKNGYLVKGRPRAFPEHHLLHSLLVVRHTVLPGRCRQVSESPVGLGVRGTPRKGGRDRLAASRDVARCPQGLTGRLSPTALQPQQLCPAPQEHCPGLDEPCCLSDPLRGARAEPAGGQHACRRSGTGCTRVLMNRTLNWAPNKADLSACQHGDS